MKPEEKARVVIDHMFANAGWQVEDRKDFSPVQSAVAVREGILVGNKEADYLLFIEGKAIGVLEAKSADTPLTEMVAQQAQAYTRLLPDWCGYWQHPLPFVYLSNGKELLFRDMRDLHVHEYSLIQRIHTPKEMVKLAGIKNEHAGLPALSHKGLRQCQFDAVSALEDSFRQGKQRALLVLATGAGKTYTACTIAYRLLSYAPLRRILFLVDRNNLGKQAEGEFGMYRLTETGEPFNTIFGVERLKSARIPDEANVVISTIQRIFAVLTGKEFTDEDEVEGVQEGCEEISLGSNPHLPSDYFDLIIVDECHRSIYGTWKQVLTYFNNARIIGLTATPAPETMAFFNNNRILNYSLEKSIADGINVNYRVYRIKTKVTEEGGTIEEKDKVNELVNYTGESHQIVMEEQQAYRSTDLDRSVINPTQIRIVLENFRDTVYMELFPERTPELEYLPKTLIFAKNDKHASTIVQIAKKVFSNQSDDFVQKITYSVGDSAELIRHFRNDKAFRIAVTVNLVSTGTDIKPLEILLFMRDVASEILYTQMKGRGVRTIGDEQLRNVTPNAISKDLFWIVDAVGVTESEKYVSKPQTDTTTANPTLEQLLERISHGYLPDDYLYMLANSLSRIHAKSSEKHRTEFVTIAGRSMYDMAATIFDALEKGGLPLFVHVNDANAEREALVALLANNIEARQCLLKLNAGFVKILIPGEDELIYRGFSIEEASETTHAFESYIRGHRDEIEALRIIYNNQGDRITYTMLKDLKEKLYAIDIRFKMLSLWNSYSIIQANRVIKLKSQTEREALTNLIQLVRYGYQLIPELRSLPSVAAQRFELWCGQRQRPLTDTQRSVMREVVDYIVSNGYYSNNELRDENLTLFAQMVKRFGSKDMVNDVLSSLSGWMLKAS